MSKYIVGKKEYTDLRRKYTGEKKYWRVIIFNGCVRREEKGGMRIGRENKRVREKGRVERGLGGESEGWMEGVTLIQLIEHPWIMRGMMRDSGIKRDGLNAACSAYFVTLNWENTWNWTL